MYFIARKRWFFPYIAEYPVWSWYFLTLIVIAAFLGIWYISFFKYIHSLHSYYQNKILHLSQQEEQVLCNNQDICKARESLRAHQDELKVLRYKAESSDLSIKKLPRLILEQSLRLDSYALGKTIQKKWYKKKQVHCLLQGDFSAVYDFLQRVSAEPYITVDTISYVKSDDILLKVTVLFNIITITH
jgi:Tfp pilus assembly protein PilO